MAMIQSIDSALEETIGAHGASDKVLNDALGRAESALDFLRVRHADGSLPLLRLPDAQDDLASIRAAKVAFETTDFRTKLARYHANVDDTFRAWNDIWLDPGFPEWNIEAYLDSIRCPVLCIQGEEDEYGTRAQVDTVVAKVPGAVLVMLPKCGHSPHRDQREATLAKMTEFVAKINDTPRTTPDNADPILKTES